MTQTPNQSLEPPCRWQRLEPFFSKKWRLSKIELVR